MNEIGTERYGTKLRKTQHRNEKIKLSENKLKAKTFRKHGVFHQL